MTKNIMRFLWIVSTWMVVFSNAYDVSVEKMVTMLTVWALLTYYVIENQE